MKSVLTAALLLLVSSAIAASEAAEPYWYDQRATSNMSIDTFGETFIERLNREACRSANPPPQCVTPRIKLMDVHINETIVIERETVVIERPASSKQLDK